MQHKEYIVTGSLPLSDALARLGSMSNPFLLVVNDQRLIGTLTDGDVRRALLRGLSLQSQVREVMNPNPITGLSTSLVSELRDIMVSRKIKFLPLVDRDGNLEDVTLLDETVVTHEPSRALIMAGGLGQRLRPYTENTPKPMLKIGGVPLLQTLVSQLRMAGFNKVTISINYLGDQIKRYFDNGSRFGVEIDYIDELQRMGTIGAAAHFANAGAGPLLIMNGDLLTNTNLRSFMDFHRSMKSDLTMGVRLYSNEVPYGVVNMRGVKILSLEEKPKIDFFVNAGLYIAEQHILDILKPVPLDITDFISNLLSTSDARINAFPIHEYWQDIGREDDLLKARSDYYNIFS